MRHTSTITSLSWIPSEAVKGMTKMPFEIGVAHYDETPPSVLEGPDALEELRAGDRFRFANRLTAWIDVEDGKIVGHGQEGGGVIGSTTMRLGKKRAATYAAVSLPDLRPEPEVGEDFVRFTQTAGGRTGVPAPRHVNRPPFVQVIAPLAWATLQVTLYADGRAESEMVGGSPFPRHWVYGDDGALVAKTGVIDFATWYRTAFGKHSPWGDEDSPALVTAVETALERELSEHIMKRGEEPHIRRLAEGKVLTEQGDAGDELFLILDGVLSVEVDGQPLGELGPGALVGERAVIEGGVRTSTLRAVTRCTVAVAPGDRIDPALLADLAEGHRREDRPRLMRVHVLGVRGSTPAPGAEFVRYGGHTSCLAIAHGDAAPTLVLDAGTGARRLGELLGEAPFRGSVLLTHLHWDHTHGIPFAHALDHPDAQVALVLPAPPPGEAGERPGAAAVLARGMAPPHFPITPEQLRGDWTFTAAEPSTFEAGGFEVTAVEVPHKGGRTYGYRVTDGAATIAYVPDHGPVALGPGPDGLGERHPAAIAVAQGVDALFHDAQHLVEEFAAVAGFGHDAIEYAVDLGRAASATEVVLFHHDPNRTDAQLDAIAERWASHERPRVTVARQDRVLELG